MLLNSRIRRIAHVFLGIACSAGVSVAQDVRRAEPASRYQPPSAPSGPSAIERSGMSAVPVDPNRRLAVGDIVTFEILEDRETPQVKKVTATGELDISPLGRVRVSGKSTDQAAADIKAYLEKDYYHVATVRLGLDTINPVAAIRKVIVAGEVRGPGTLEIAAGETLTLSEAILRAGNFAPFALSDKVELTRKGQKSVHDVRGIFRDPSRDLALDDGDRIFVPRTWFKIKSD
jgi:protein involved in polysaccharide export with SLBB domain